MKLVYKSKAWGIILSDLMVCHLSRRLKFIRPEDGGTVKNIKTSCDYYDSIHQMKCLKMVFAFSLYNLIDVYDLNTGELIRTIKWNGNAKFERMQLAIDEEKKSIYCILYCGIKGENESLISMIDCVSWKEEVVLSLRGIYAFDIQYFKKEQEYIITGKQFCKFPQSIRVSGIYKGIGMNSRKEFLYDMSNKRRIQYLTKVRFMENGDILYYIDCKIRKVYRLGENKAILEKVDETAFSHNGKYIAYIKNGKITVLDYLSWRVVDTVDSVVGHIYVFEFEDLDRHIIYKADETSYLYEIEFGTERLE